MKPADPPEKKNASGLSCGHRAPTPRAVIFDLGKVIVDFDHMTICDRLAACCGQPAAAVYDHIFRSGLEKQFDSGTLSPRQFYNAVRSRLSVPVDIDRFALLWSDIFTLQPGMDALLARLRGRYRLLCLSNTNPWHFSWCRRHFTPLEAFDDVIVSYEHRCCKPDSAIYRIAVRKAGALPHQCVFIDDSPDNVRAAARLGIRSFVYTGLDELLQNLAGTGIIDISGPPCMQTPR